jgi:hypothetical protein
MEDILQPENTINNSITGLTKTEITDLVSNSEILKKIFTLYKNNKTEGHVYNMEFSQYSGANGLLKSIYVFTINDQIIDIILPIFTSKKTSTWDFKYNQIIADTLKDDYKLDVGQVTELTKTAIFYLVDKEVSFLSLLNVSDFINYGQKGQNGKSVYFWNDKLPNQYSLNMTNLKSDLFVKLLPQYNNKQLMKICLDYATINYSKFNNEQKRGSKTIISNISKGLYAQIKVYLQLKSEGHQVNMHWKDQDDLGIDITLESNGININIDVKSTSDEFLKISKFRKETDFYAIVNWIKTEPKLLGFIIKYSFWKSDIYNSKSPIKDEKTGLFYKKITKKWQKEFLKIEGLFSNLQEYKKSKIKQKEQLFDL